MGRFPFLIVMLAIMTNLAAGAVSAADLLVDWAGGGSYTTIDAAMAAAQPGDMIKVAEGMYTGSYLEPMVAMSILGGYTATDWSRDLDLYVTILDVGGDGVGFLLDDVDGCTVDGFTITNFSWVGIQVETSSPTVSNNIIIGGAADFCLFGMNGNPTISNNTMTGAEYGIYYNVYDYGYGQGRDEPTITYNEISGCTQDGIYMNVGGYEPRKAERIQQPIITNNIVSQVGETGIRCLTYSTGPSLAQEPIISHNVVSECGYYGIKSSTDSYGPMGKLAPQISDNQVSDIGQAGIGFQADSSDPMAVHNPIIRNNRVNGASFGGILSIVYHGIHEGSIDNNRVENISGQEIPNGIGLGVGTYMGSCAAEIKNNLVMTTNGMGLAALNFIGSLDAVISNNTVTGNSADGVTLYYTGYGVNNASVTNNIISDNGGYGINNFYYYLSPQSRAAVIDYNDVYNNAAGDYLDCSPGPNDISAEPFFVPGPDGFKYLSDPISGNPSEVVKSPAIDAGSGPATGIVVAGRAMSELNTRSNGANDSGVVDLGYHYDDPTPTAGPSPSPTMAPTSTPEPTATASPEPTASPTNSPEPPTETPTETPTITPTDSPTLTPSATVPPSATVEPATLTPTVEPLTPTPTTTPGPQTVPALNHLGLLVLLGAMAVALALARRG
ncbi:right-handed parallel beta-helix repeat-containing protein [bacterium]|nr:right-handed parallel beta-helix repeat-containing protein [candidate division CSSED10-310 bacterium]